MEKGIEDRPALLIIDAETGEIIGKIEEGSIIISKEEAERYRRKRQIKESERGGYIPRDVLERIADPRKSFKTTGKRFIKISCQEYESIWESLSKNERILLGSLLPHIRNDCILYKSNGNEFKAEDIYKASGLSRRAVTEGIKGLTQKGILAKKRITGKRGQGYKYLFNPFIAENGAYHPIEILQEFSEYEIQSERKKKVKEAYDLKETE